ncbi:MAG: hypothetical protein KGI97_01060 [Alphaproteobacteria bacterium]|nr:hypothetical protein [Alphaproteobacteria bacterium]
MSKRSLFRFLSIALIMALAFSQPVGAMAVASMNTECMSMDMGVASSPAGQTSTMDPGAAPAKNHAAHCPLCDACCTAAQTAVLPFRQSFVPVRYAAIRFYGLTDTVAVNLTLPPDLPPPKA